MGRCRRIDKVDAFRPEGRGFESRSSRHEGTLGKSFTYSCLYSASVCKTPIQCQLQWSGTLLKCIGCEKRYTNGTIQYNNNYVAQKLSKKRVEDAKHVIFVIKMYSIFPRVSTYM